MFLVSMCLSSYLLLSFMSLLVCIYQSTKSCSHDFVKVVSFLSEKLCSTILTDTCTFISVFSVCVKFFGPFRILSREFSLLLVPLFLLLVPSSDVWTI